MSKNHSIAFGKLCSLLAFATGGLLLASCADDGFDDNERFESSVRNTQLASPKDATISPSADGKTQTISWPVVHGAGGYQVTLFDASNMGTAVADSLVEGCSVTFKREEDVNYVLRILAKGNAALGNTDASEATEINFTTFTPTYAVIPSGANLNEWFAANPTPADSVGVNLNYDLEAGGTYTLTNVLDFNVQAVTLRNNSKSNPATIYFSGEACITFAAAFNLKYLNVDCSAQEISSTNHGIFAFSKDPSAAPIGTDIDAKYKWANPLIEKPVTFINSNFKNVKGYFFWDNQQAVCAMTMLIDNCIIHLAPEKDFSGGVFWTNKGGQINELYVTNSTFYELDGNVGDYKYFYQAGMVSGEEIFADKNVATNTVSYANSTFYHVTWNNGQWGNYNRMAGRTCSHWIMTDCIFYDCSPSGVPRRFLHGKQNQLHVTFSNNTYMKADGTFQDIKADGSHDYDHSGTTIDEDPKFANPAAGDFHISGATQVARKTGDPRWLPGAE